MKAYLLERVRERTDDLYGALTTAERRIADAKRKMVSGKAASIGFTSILDDAPSDIDMATGALRSIVSAARRAGCSESEVADACTRVVGD